MKIYTDRKSTSLEGFNDALERRRELQKNGYTIPQMQRVTGLSRTKILLWTKHRLLRCLKDTTARGSHAVAYYSPDNVFKALIISEMTKRGLSLTQVRRVEDYLKKKEKKSLTESARFLVTDGKTAYYRQNSDQVIDLLKSTNQMLLIPVWEHWLEVKGALRVERVEINRRIFK